MFPFAKSVTSRASLPQLSAWVAAMSLGFMPACSPNRPTLAGAGQLSLGQLTASKAYSKNVPSKAKGNDQATWSVNDGIISLGQNGSERTDDNPTGTDDNTSSPSPSGPSNESSDDSNQGSSGVVGSNLEVLEVRGAAVVLIVEPLDNLLTRALNAAGQEITESGGSNDDYADDSHHDDDSHHGNGNGDDDSSDDSDDSNSSDDDFTDDSDDIYHDVTSDDFLGENDDSDDKDSDDKDGDDKDSDDKDSDYGDDRRRHLRSSSNDDSSEDLACGSTDLDLYFGCQGTYVARAEVYTQDGRLGLAPFRVRGDYAVSMIELGCLDNEKQLSSETQIEVAVNVAATSGPGEIKVKARRDLATYSFELEAQVQSDKKGNKRVSVNGTRILELVRVDASTYVEHDGLFTVE